jgi:hypothetical protein
MKIGEQMSAPSMNRKTNSRRPVDLQTDQELKTELYHPDPKREETKEPDSTTQD